MIELYNGTIDVASKLNEFTEFTIIYQKILTLIKRLINI